jgi:glucose-6-phosphate isomerase
VNLDLAVSETLAQLSENDVMGRLWQHDYTLWADEPDEITNRLGWLTSPQSMASEVAGWKELAGDVRAAGYNQVVLVGMGGSSLAPALFARTFGPAAGYPDLIVLDSTDPQAVTNVRRQLDPERTLFIVSSKSGGTVETLSFFKYFYTWLVDELGEEAAGEHFVAISDPGSRLLSLAERYGFRAAFANDPNIGGRYSALSHFGLLPAALLGIDVDQLLARAQRISGPDRAERAAWLGAVLGTFARQEPHYRFLHHDPHSGKLRRLGRAANCRKHGESGRRNPTDCRRAAAGSRRLRQEPADRLPAAYRG